MCLTRILVCCVCAVLYGAAASVTISWFCGRIPKEGRSFRAVISFGDTTSLTEVSICTIGFVIYLIARQVSVERKALLSDFVLYIL